MKYRIAATTFCLLVVLGCTRATQSERAIPATGEARQGEAPAEEVKPLTSLEPVVEAGNDFGFRLFRELHGRAPDKNLFISPTSVSMALAMTWNGAEGETRRQMAEALGLGTAQPGNMSMGVSGLLGLLQEADPKVTLEVANAIWARQGIPLAEKFIKTSREYYQAEVGALDFTSPDAVRTINQWVSDRTRGKIETLFDRLEADDVVVLANAVYFKGTWTEEFDKQKTWDQDFRKGDGTARRHPMMRQGGEYRYWKGDDLELISLPYGAGRFEMLVLLPASGAPVIGKSPTGEPGFDEIPRSPGEALDRLVGQMTPENLERWLAAMTMRDGNIV
ncbi:serpin family protein, partial [candidate division WOR-3 bacterium]|nr:serpin family protein [candidate division WOR-3 bacterium]